MAPTWRALPGAILATVVATAAATTAAGAASGAGAGALSPTARQCTQAGDFPHHDGCSATVRAVRVGLAALTGRWYMWEASYDANQYHRGLLGVPPAHEAGCPTMEARLVPAKGGVPAALTVNLCMAHRPVTVGRGALKRCRRYRVRATAAGALVWTPTSGPTPRRPLPPIKVVATKWDRGTGLRSWVTYQCPAGNAPPRVPCAVKGPPEVVGTWTRGLSYPGLFASEQMARRGLGIEAANEFQVSFACPGYSR